MVEKTKIDKKHKEEIIEKTNPDKYEISWNEEGVPYKFKKKSEIQKGKKSHAAGSRFELKVRADLESKGRIVDKWNNNVDLDSGKLVIAKRKYNPFSKVMTIGTGFPDFISIKQIYEGVYSVIGVEVKMNGVLSKTEKEKCVWYLKKGVFSEIWIAKAVKNGRKAEVVYDDFAEKYRQKYNKT